MSRKRADLANTSTQSRQHHHGRERERKFFFFFFLFCFVCERKQWCRPKRKVCILLSTPRNNSLLISVHASESLLVGTTTTTKKDCLGIDCRTKHTHRETEWGSRCNRWWVGGGRAVLVMCSQGPKNQAQTRRSKTSGRKKVRKNRAKKKKKKKKKKQTARQQTRAGDIATSRATTPSLAFLHSVWAQPWSAGQLGPAKHGYAKAEYKQN